MGINKIQSTKKEWSQTFTAHLIAPKQPTIVTNHVDIEAFTRPSTTRPSYDLHRPMPNGRASRSGERVNKGQHRTLSFSAERWGPPSPKPVTLIGEIMTQKTRRLPLMAAVGGHELTFHDLQEAGLEGGDLHAIAEPYSSRLLVEEREEEERGFSEEREREGGRELWGEAVFSL